MAEHQSSQNASEGNGFIVQAKPKQVLSAKLLIWFAVGIFMLLALAVVFVLPNYVKSPDNSELVPVTVTEKTKKQTQPLNESPWQDAQIAKYRREAQEILSKLLSKQQKLEKMKVEVWAPDEFNQAKKLAQQADVLYRQREFVQAQQEYLKVADAFDEITSLSKSIFEQTMVEGKAAVESLEAANAIEKFDLATALNPDSEDAALGFRRAMSLEEVVGLVEEAEQLANQKNFVAAKDSLKQAYRLDQDSPYVKSKIDWLNTTIIDHNFNNAMSKGYAAIKDVQFDRAIKSFSRAMKLKPSSNDAKQALELANNKKDDAALKEIFRQANTYEAQEEWQLANDEFKKALEVDETLVTAKVGDIRTSARAKLHTHLTNAIKDKHRLSSPAVYKESKQILAQARKIRVPGAVLKQQIVDLSDAIEDSQKEVLVRFESDNATQVRLKRIGDLGTFVAKNLPLVPGKYTAIGTRLGYRDVVRDFSIETGGQSTTIIVQCSEKIVN